MPKIVIKEIDKTAAGNVFENNFSVVVPGKKGDSGTGIGIDENGIFECSSVSEFEEVIGKVATTTGVEAVAPTCEILSGEETVETKDNTYAEFSVYDFYKYFNTGEIYTRVQIVSPVPTSVGKLRKKFTEDSTDYWFNYVKVESAKAWWNNIKPDVDAWTANTAYDIDEEVIANNLTYVCIKAHTSGTEFEVGENWSLVPNPKFSVILAGNEGIDGSTQAVNVGNQLAYLLLKLGYKVLYLVIDAAHPITNLSTWEPLKDRSAYNFRYLVSGLLDDEESSGYMQKVNDNLVAIADGENSGRGDCVALIDVPKNIYKGMTTAAAISAIKSATLLTEVSKYAACFAPTILYNGITDEVYTNNELPASFHYLACAANAFEKYPEWYAVAGYNRGICGLSVAGPSVKFGEAAVNALQPRVISGSFKSAINIVAKFGDTYYLWGNRTSALLDNEGLVASHFLNIRQLCCTLKKSIYDACKSLMFDPNSDVLWLNFCNAIRPELENMKANQGIKDYRFEKKETSVKGKLFAAVRIIPIEAVEDFEIGITLEDNFDEATISISESAN